MNDRAQLVPGRQNFWRALLLAVCLPVAACDPATTEQDEPRPEAYRVQITASVPDDAPTVYLTGNHPDLGPWDPAALEMSGAGAMRTASLMVSAGQTLRFKITAGSWEREALGPAGEKLPEYTMLVDADKDIEIDVAAFPEDPMVFIRDWPGADVEGQLVYWTNVESGFLDESRHVVIWLPPGYDAASDRSYKVIYAQDGQNLFDPRLSYTGVDWGLDEAMMRGVRAGLFEPAIVVGIWNTPDRLLEYSPWHDAPQYTRFLLEELKPRVDAEFNVLTGADNTFALGASMGGLVSFYLVKEHPDVFGGCGCLSSHLSWSEQMLDWYMGRDPSGSDAVTYLERDIRSGDSMPPGKALYFDYGTEGLDASYDPPHQVLQRWLLEQGYEIGRNLRIEKVDGADHNEAAWRRRVGDHLEWLLQTSTDE